MNAGLTVARMNGTTDAYGMDRASIGLTLRNQGSLPEAREPGVLESDLQAGVE